MIRTRLPLLQYNGTMEYYRIFCKFSSVRNFDAYCIIIQKNYKLFQDHHQLRRISSALFLQRRPLVRSGFAARLALRPPTSNGLFQFNKAVPPPHPFRWNIKTVAIRRLTVVCFFHVDLSLQSFRSIVVLFICANHWIIQLIDRGIIDWNGSMFYTNFKIDLIKNITFQTRFRFTLLPSAISLNILTHVISFSYETTNDQVWLLRMIFLT